MGEYEHEIELYDYIEVLFAYKWVIVGATLLCGAASWLLSPQPPPPDYKADAVLMVKRLPGVEGLQDNVTAGHNTSGFYEKLALADDLKQALIDSLGLQSMSLRGLDNMLQVAVLDPGVQLTVRSKDPDLTRRMVNKWAEVFVERNSDVNVNEVGSYYEFVTESYETSLARLESVEARLDSFEAVNQINFLEVKKAIFDSTATRTYNELFDVESRLAEIKFELQVAEDRLEVAEANSSDGTDWGLEGTQLTSLVKLRESKASLAVNMEKALITFDERHEFDELRRRIRVAEQDSLHLVISGIERELHAHEPIIGGLPNPTYIELSQQLAERRIALKLLSAYEAADSGHTANTAQELDSPRQLYNLVLEKRNALIADFTSQDQQLEKQRQQIEDLHNLSLVKRMNQFAVRDSLASELVILRAVKNSRRARLDAVRDSLKVVKNALANKKREENRLTRSQQRLAETVSNFSSRLEDARIAREKAAGDIRVLTRALEAQQMPQDPIQTKTAIAAGVGFLVSTILSLLIEYMRKARALRPHAVGAQS